MTDVREERQTHSPLHRSPLTTAEFARLNHACVLVTECFGDPPYLVGAALGYEYLSDDRMPSDANPRQSYRDVDVRSIISDDEWDRLFNDHSEFWSLFCLSVSTYLSAVSGLPIDYQVQRMTQANEQHPKPRNPIGTRRRLFAGGGDAQP